MNFVSADYALLLTTTFVLYWVVPWRRLRLLIVLVASYIFYMTWSEKFVALLWFSTGLDFLCGWMIAGSRTDRARGGWLWVSLVGNLGVLGLFKYFNFFYESAVVVLQQLGLHPHEFSLRLILPLGISFYTFQSLSYSIDVYRGDLRPTKSLLEFATFIAFFPQLVAGPIVRARDLLPQMVETQHLNWTDVQYGLERILLGLVKKAIVADNLAIVVNHIFNNLSPETTATNAWMAGIAFYGQVYCDFSGYSDIAIGSSRLFGFHLKENFRIPYRAASPRDLWLNWHVTWASWLRDYVYYPLGGNRRGVRRTYINMFLTNVISGLWHGAAWTFVLWGVYNGFVLCLHRAWSRAGQRLPHWAGLVLTLAFFITGALMFRANSTADMFQLLGLALHVPNTLPNTQELLGLLLCLAIFYGEPLAPQVKGLYTRPVLGPVLRGILVGSGVALLMAATPVQIPDFIYFVF